jgi:uncharacterized protein
MTDLSSKITIVEEEPTIRGIPSAPTSVVGAVGITERGPIGKPVLCTSFGEYTRTFGSFTKNSDLALAAMGFFENGGRQLYVVRTAHYADIKDATSVTARRALGMLVGDKPDGTSVQVVKIEGKDPGSYANQIKVEVKVSATEKDRVDLAVVLDGKTRETYTGLSADQAHARFIEKLVNDPKSGSGLVRLAVQTGSEGILPKPQSVQLAGGDDGLSGLTDQDFVGSELSKTGLRALDSVQDLSLLMIPGMATPVVHTSMIQYCEVARSSMVFAVLDPPADQSAQEIVEYVRTTAKLEEATEHAAIYWPRVRILNPAKAILGSDDTITVPPSGIICGVYARNDGAQPGGIYDPPAGIEKGKMLGVVGFENDETLEEAKRDLIYPWRINPLTTGPSMPRYIDGSRTLKGTGNFPYIGERRGVTFIERSLKDGLQFARHKNNTEALRAQVQRTITSFLMTQMNNGAFRSKEPEKAFFVDLSENGEEEILAGRLNVRVGLATNKPAEFIELRFSQILAGG